MTTTYTRGGVRYRREVLVTTVDQLMVVRLSASAPRAISFVLRPAIRG